MRIVLTSASSPWDPSHGGGQIATHHLAWSLARRGHDVGVVYSSLGGKRPDLCPGDLPYRAEFVRHHERLYLNPFEHARRLRGRAMDVLHSQGYEGALLRPPGDPRAVRVATSHHPDPPPLEPSPPWLRPLTRIRWARGQIVRRMERRALMRADAVVCVSAHSAAVLRERGYLPRDARVRVVHNGNPLEQAVREHDIREPAIREQATGEQATGEQAMSGSGTFGAPEAARLLCVARLDRHKGIDVLLDALTRLDERVSLDLVGGGLLEAEIRGRTRSLGLGSRVRFHGTLPREEVADLLFRARILVLPSLAENFPLVILEAMYAGAAIVATTVGGIPEAVRDGREALLVPPGDAEALAAALTRVLGDEALRMGLVEAARARSRDFTWDRAAERMEEVYLELRG